MRKGRRVTTEELNSSFGVKQLFTIFFFMLAVFLIMAALGTNNIYVNKSIDKSSEWYVNDLYMSDQYYYDKMLNDEEKKLYKEFFDHIKNMDEEVNYFCTLETMRKVIDAISCDHPEMINFVGYSYTENTIEFRYLCKDQKELNKKVKKVQKSIYKISKKIHRDMSDYEKEKIIYEFLAETSPYGVRFDRSDQSAYTAFIKGKSTVCAGYAKAAQILLQTFEMDSHIIINENHMWNIVALDDQYYYFDATNSSDKKLDEGISYTGLNTSITTSNYISEYLNSFPEALGTKYNYYDYEEKTLEYDANDLSNIKKLLNDIDKKQLEIKVKNSTEFRDDIEGIKDKLDLKDIRYYDSGYLMGCKVFVLIKK